MIRQQPRSTLFPYRRSSDLLVQLCLAHQHLRGRNFDLPVVGPVFEEYVKTNGLSDRLSFLPGNFFDEPLPTADRSEEHTSELQSRLHLVCRLLLEKKK